MKHEGTQNEGFWMKKDQREVEYEGFWMKDEEAVTINTYYLNEQ
ncbi:MAG: hypothetical protein QNJ32_10920 [Xenococcaceae cyanobacterium MO_167.B27]|nr:hypothetical protein [Xenococcaceae cyanobacterium MO_167.B27]